MRAAATSVGGVRAGDGRGRVALHGRRGARVREAGPIGGSGPCTRSPSRRRGPPWERWPRPACAGAPHELGRGDAGGRRDHRRVAVVLGGYRGVRNGVRRGRRRPPDRRWAPRPRRGDPHGVRLGRRWPAVLAAGDDGRGRGVAPAPPGPPGAATSSGFGRSTSRKGQADDAHSASSSSPVGRRVRGRRLGGPRGRGRVRLARRPQPPRPLVVGPRGGPPRALVDGGGRGRPGAVAGAAVARARSGWVAAALGGAVGLAAVALYWAGLVALGGALEVVSPEARRRRGSGPFGHTSSEAWSTSSSPSRWASPAPSPLPVSALAGWWLWSRNAPTRA